MMPSRNKPHWRRLIWALGQEAHDLHGFGSLTVKITFVDGLPVQMDTLERRCTRRLDRNCKPATTAARGTQTGADVVS